MEGYFNAANKIIYGIWMMKNVRDHNLMPEKIFSKCNRMADDGTLCKTLFYDITRQAQVLAAIASVDASNCYDRIAHAMDSLVFQAFGVPTMAIGTMLGAIENMKFFLRTGFGNSTEFAGGGISMKTQGLCQGNGALPAGWAVMSICILRAHGKKGHSAKFLCPITKLQQQAPIRNFIRQQYRYITHRSHKGRKRWWGAHSHTRQRQQLGKITNCHGRSSAATKMLLLSNIIWFEKRWMAICSKRNPWRPKNHSALTRWEQCNDQA